MLLLVLLAGPFSPAPRAHAGSSRAEAAQSDEVTAFDLILAMNTLRVSLGNRALVEDPTVMAVAQATAEIMAANQMSWHIGDVDGRLAAAGYGGGAKVWATENFAYGNLSIDEIMVAWSDADHMLPATNSAYCHVGAGVAKAPNGFTYYVLQAAYISGKTCTANAPPGGGTPPPGGAPGGVPQFIVPVKIATPDIDGRVYHIVEAGQSFWSIAVAYKVTIRDLEIWNNLSRENGLRIGQRLFIPGSNTVGYATPTPVGMVLTSTPDADGRIVHVVQPYQNLTTIAQAYKVEVDQILALNGLQVDWPLQIDQKLLIDPGHVTPSPTPRPLTPIEKLTPESDGKYYHTVQSGETLSWIADLYEVSLAELMAWNGLNAASIIRPSQKLLLQVTPPATETPTPAPPTDTATATLTPPARSPSPTATRPAASRTAEAETPATGDGNPAAWILPVGLAAGVILVVVIARRKQG
jgi:LysM repeat protein